MRYITHNGKLLAVVFRLEECPTSCPETLVLTPPDWGLQICLLSRCRDYHVRPHTHVRERPLGEACEMLLVLRGRVRVVLYDEGAPVEELVLSSGEGIVMRCGHEVTILEDSQILEVKEGPYPGPDRDKIWLKER